MYRLRRLFVALAAIVGLVALPSPAQAGQGVFGVTGNMNTSGTWAQYSSVCGVTCPAVGSWAITASATGVHNGSARTATLSASGSYYGWCTDAHGVGNMTVDGESFPIAWGMQGGHMTIRAQGGGHRYIHGEIDIRPIAGNCFTAAATSFLASGTIWLVA